MKQIIQWIGFFKLTARVFLGLVVFVLVSGFSPGAKAEIRPQFSDTYFEGLRVNPASQTGDLDAWVLKERDISRAQMFLNISAPGTARGSVIASPSQANPNYFYYWVRDGSLTMATVLELFERSTGQDQNAYAAMFEDFRNFTRVNQLTNSPPGLGDPRYKVDGTADLSPWGRPQSDGPALRALMFTHFAQDIIRLGRGDYVAAYLYTPGLPANTVIKADLEYVANHWQDKSFDLWEEIRGQHFFTRAVQYAALVEGGALAVQLGDPSAASFYRTAANALDQALNSHWSEQRGYYLATLDSEAGPDHQKPSQLDSAVILATLAAGQTEGTLSPLSDRILATARALERSFAAIYPINQNKTVGTAIGRYTEDYYFGGNPWFLTTSAFAELHYKVATVLASRSTYYLTPLSADFFASAVPANMAPRFIPGIDIAADPTLKAVAIHALIAKGDSFLQRVRLHLSADGTQSEQYYRDTGFTASAPNLTWSYASFIKASFARDAAYGL